MKKIVFFTIALALSGNLSYAESADTTVAPTSDTTASPETSNTQADTQTATSATQDINCTYHIPPEKTDISEHIIVAWSKNAAVESFEFDHAKLDKELESLESCYTKEGWKSFHDALKKSGNLQAIKTQNLTVKSKIDGEVTLKQEKENQWKATVPMEVVYQNEKEKLTQLLTVDLLIGRKMSGDLGVMQLIATPRLAKGAGEPSKTGGEAQKDGDEQTTTPAE